MLMRAFLSCLAGLGLVVGFAACGGSGGNGGTDTGGADTGGADTGGADTGGDDGGSLAGPIVSGVVFLDVNDDGIRDAGDVLIEGVLVNAIENGNPIPAVATDTNGVFVFSDATVPTPLTPGATLQIHVDLLDGAIAAAIFDNLDPDPQDTAVAMTNVGDDALDNDTSLVDVLGAPSFSVTVTVPAQGAVLDTIGIGAIGEIPPP